MAKKKDLKKLLEYDALHEAEEMTGGSVDDPKSIAHGIGIRNFFENNAKKKEALLAYDDTAYHCSMENYLRIAKAIGFEQVLEIPFLSTPYSGKPIDERFLILWRKGLLLTCETYNGKDRDGAYVHFNVKPHKDEDFSKINGDGTGVEHEGYWVRIGGLDVREGLRFSVEHLEEVGTILEKWVARPPHLRLMHPEDWKKHNWKTAKDVPNYLSGIDALVEERIAMLPRHIQEAIGPIKCG